jgi:H+-transporting ATPase
VTPSSHEILQPIEPPLGLTSERARGLLSDLGSNVIAEGTAPRWRRFLGKFWSPIAWMLEGAVVLQLGLGEYVEAAVVGGLLVFNAVLGFLHESRARAAVAALKERLAPTALVRRDGVWSRIPASGLVPGDAITLVLGALVPADARLVSGSLMVDQSMLTGESIPVEAEPGAAVFTGSLVRRGQAIAEVTATGARTRFGRAAELVREAHAASTEQKAILGATRNLAVVNAFVALLIVGSAYAMALPVPDLIGLALTALLASIPVALPATFTLSAALAARTLARRGALLTRLSAAHEAATMDLLCSDKTGTLTRAVLEVAEVSPLQGFDREQVLALAALASSEVDQDPIDAAIRRSVSAAALPAAAARLLRFVPFDPATRTSEAVALDRDGRELRIVKGALAAIEAVAEVPRETRGQADALGEQGNRVIAVAVGSRTSMRIAGLVALSDPPREDSGKLVAELGELGVRTIMVTGDSPTTAAAIARQVGIEGAVCPPERLAKDPPTEECGVFARVVPEAKYELVKAAQRRGHVVGMCGDGVNDAPALRQAQIGIAVSTATDAAKAAAGMVLTEPGLGGIVFAVREGRVAFQRLLTYALNMLVKKMEIVLFLAIGLWLTGHAIVTPKLMVLLLVTNDFLSMSLTTDRAKPAPSPRVWRMDRITAVALVLALFKLAFSTAALAFGKFYLKLETSTLQTLVFLTLVFGNQALLYVVRERGRMWSSRPSPWVLAASCVDLSIVSVLVLSGILMEPLSWPLVLSALGAAGAFALLLDQIKLPLTSAANLE